LNHAAILNVVRIIVIEADLMPVIFAVHSSQAWERETSAKTPNRTGDNRAVHVAPGQAVIYLCGIDEYQVR
jgi:hypothetical protein